MSEPEDLPPLPILDRSRKRPLELRVRNLSDEGGISESDAARYKRYAADGLLIFRLLETAVPNQKQLAVLSVNGPAGVKLDVPDLFGVWIAFTRMIADGADKQDELQRRQGVFLTHVLRLLRLDESIGVIQATASTPASPSSDAPPPAGCSAPEDGSGPTSG